MAGYMEVIRQELSMPKLDSKPFPKSPKPSTKFREHGKDVVPQYSVLNDEYVLCMKGPWDDGKGKMRIKDNMQIPGPVARSMEIAFVDTSKIINYLDVFNLTTRNVSSLIQEQLKEVFPPITLDDSSDDIMVSRQKIDALQSCLC